MSACASGELVYWPKPSIQNVAGVVVESMVDFTEYAPISSRPRIHPNNGLLILPGVTGRLFRNCGNQPFMNLIPHFDDLFFQISIVGKLNHNPSFAIVQFLPLVTG